MTRGNRRDVDRKRGEQRRKRLAKQPKQQRGSKQKRADMYVVPRPRALTESSWPGVLAITQPTLGPASAPWRSFLPVLPT